MCFTSSACACVTLVRPSGRLNKPTNLLLVRLGLREASTSKKHTNVVLTSAFLRHRLAGNGLQWPSPVCVSESHHSDGGSNGWISPPEIGSSPKHTQAGAFNCSGNADNMQSRCAKMQNAVSSNLTLFPATLLRHLECSHCSGASFGQHVISCTHLSQTSFCIPDFL